MKKVTKYDIYFGCVAAWDLAWGTFNLAAGKWGLVIFYIFLTGLTLLLWRSTHKNILRQNNDTQGSVE